MYEQDERTHETVGLQIESSIADNLPSMVKVTLSKMSQPKQSMFVEEYKRKKKSIGWAYIFHLILFASPYVYLGKWGLQFLYWVTGCGAFVWWLVLCFTIPGMVRDYNKDVAMQIVRDLQIMG